MKATTLNVALHHPFIAIVKKYCIPLISTVLILTFSSCASLFNAKYTNFKIITNVPSKLILNGDSLNIEGTNKLVTLDRSKKPFKVTAYTDSVSKTVSVKAVNSFAYWLNIYPSMPFWTGFLIDAKASKRYTYPRIVYINLTKNDSRYLTYQPLSESYHKHSNILKITPLKLIGLVNPAFELSYERKTGNSFSTQIMASFLLPRSVWFNDNDINHDIKGFRVSLEEKFYFKKSAPIGPYIGLEFNYLKNRYKDTWNFGVENVYTDSTYNFTNYADEYGINKQTYSLNFKFGYQQIVKRLSFDIYGGLGLKYKDVVHFDRMNPDDAMEMPRHPNVFYITNRNGRSWTVSIPLNIRIGWTF